MFFIKDKIVQNDKEIESDVVNIINNGNVIDLPNIEEICSTCGTRKSLSDSHCFRCKGCLSNRFFHSNLFQICITKHNIKRYLFYVFLKINFYLLCFLNCSRGGQKNVKFFEIFALLKFKNGFFNTFFELFILFLLLKEFGHFTSMILSLTLKTPYQFIFKYHKKVYPNTLKEKAPNNMVVQCPEMSEIIPYKDKANNLINNIY
jgi:hypothetical protein